MTTNALRDYVLTIYPAAVDLVTQTCCNCGVLFAMTSEFDQHARQNRDKWWYCPNGHKQHYTGPTDADRLRKAEAREVALQDQLTAAIRDAEESRVQLLRDRQRYANGVCPCCTRYFANVHRHMTTQHPEIDSAEVRRPPRFKCSCGYVAGSFRGLRTHQGKSRSTSGGWRWDKPNQTRWFAHLTEVR